jgi:hypothetical protein
MSIYNYKRYVCVFTDVFIYINVYVSVCIYAYMHTCILKKVGADKLSKECDAYIQLQEVYMYICMCAFIYIHMYIYIYIYMYIYMYIYE